MKRLLLFIFPLAVMACSNGTGTDHDTNNNQPSQATVEDLKVVEETEATKSKAASATNKADSILNSL